tara:strand:- start:3678 stop:4301 length:624 start_codon:yes stop_codon:yes gene_type:complete
MRIFLIKLILIFSLQFWAMADDIREFEIEGMSLGDSLLDYFDKDEIEAEKYNKSSLMYKNNEYVQIGASYKKFYRLNVSSKTYDDLSIVLKTKDKSYKIYSLGGRIFCKDIEACKKQKSDIEEDLKNLFGKNVEIVNQDKDHSYDPTGNSKSYSTFFNFDGTNDYAFVAVYDWGTEIENKKDWTDSLRVTIISAEFSNFLNNVQYKN